MAASQKSIWAELAELPGSFPENGEKVKDILRNYYQSLPRRDRRSSIESTVSQFFKDIALDKRIEYLAIVVYGDMHIEIPGTSEIYRGRHELSKKILQSSEFWEGITQEQIEGMTQEQIEGMTQEQIEDMIQEQRKEATVKIFSCALTGDDNTALKAMKESFESGKDTGYEDYKFIYFCVAIKNLFLKLLFVDQREFALTLYPDWSNMSVEEQNQILPKPILNNSECEEVIAKLIPILYPGKKEEDYYRAIEISNLQKKKTDDEKVSAGKETPKSTHKQPKESPFLTFNGKFSKTKRERNTQSELNEADVYTPLKPKTIKRRAKREEEGNSRKAEVQNSSTNNKLKIGLMGGGGLLTLGIGIGLLFVPGLQVIGISCIVLGASIAIKAADNYLEEDKKANVQQHSREKKEDDKPLRNIASESEGLSSPSSSPRRDSILKDIPVASTEGKRVFAIDYSDSSSSLVSLSSFWGKRYGTAESLPPSSTPVKRQG